MFKHIGEDIASEILSYSSIPASYSRVSKSFEKGAKTEESMMKNYIAKKFPLWDKYTEDHLYAINLAALEGKWDIVQFLIKHRPDYYFSTVTKLRELLHAFGRLDILVDYCKSNIGRDILKRVWDPMTKKFYTKLEIKDNLCISSSDFPVDVYYAFYSDNPKKHRFKSEITSELKGKPGFLIMSGYVHPDMEKKNLLIHNIKRTLHDHYGYLYDLLGKNFDPTKREYSYINLMTYSKHPEVSLYKIMHSKTITPEMLIRAYTLAKQVNEINISELDVSDNDVINPVILHMIPQLEDIDIKIESL